MRAKVPMLPPSYPRAEARGYSKNIVLSKWYIILLFGLRPKLQISGNSIHKKTTGHRRG